MSLSEDGCKSGEYLKRVQGRAGYLLATRTKSPKNERQRICTTCVRRLKGRFLDGRGQEGGSAQSQEVLVHRHPLHLFLEPVPLLLNRLHPLYLFHRNDFAIMQYNHFKTHRYGCGLVVAHADNIVLPME